MSGLADSGLDFAADEPAHEHRHQGDRKQRRSGHGIGLGEGQRLEQATGLLGEGEHRGEGNRDHQERIKERRSDFAGGIQDDLPVGFAAAIALQMLVGVLDHDDRGVDHGTDGNGNAAQAHDIGVDPLGMHDHKGQQNGHRQGADGHQSAGQMGEKQQGHHGDDNGFLQELFLESGHGPLNQPGTVIGCFDGDPFRQTGF